MTSEALDPWLDGLRPEHGLSPAQDRVFEIVRRNQQLASYSEISEIAMRAGVDNSTVVRCAQSLGFRGWPGLQQELRARYLAELSTEQTLEEHASGTGGVVHDAVRHDIDNLRRALHTVEPEVAAATVDRLAAARRILVLGQGSFAGPAIVLAHLGATMGYDIAHEGRGGPHLATAVNALTRDDILVVVNPWRPMRDIVDAVGAARARDVPIVAITDIRKGLLASLSDLLLVVPSEGVSFFQSVTATTAVVYGLLAGMQAAQPDRTRAALQGMQRHWRSLGTYAE